MNDLITSNYPYRLVDDFILIVAIILANTTSNIVK